MVGTAGAIIITVLVLAAAAGVGWVAYSRWRAQKLGLPPPSFTSFLPFLSKSDHSASYGGPSPRPGGVQGWFSDQLRKFKDRGNRSATGAYEGAPLGGSSSGPSGRRGFGPLDPDEAWDARVGAEADYGPYGEEQELGLHTPQHGGQSGLGLGPYGRDDTAYGGSRHEPESYAMNLAATPRVVTGASGGAGAGFDDSRGRSAAGRNPFDDDAAEPSNLSLRGVSPRPMDGEREHRATKGGGGGDSPSERRSIFTEQDL